MQDTLGDRMKEFYEDRTRYSLPRRTYAIIRIDGKAFHTYTKDLKKPFDDDLMDDMDNVGVYLCANIQGAKFAFVQSDEISILVTDFEEVSTSAWFDNNLQKMCSISASLATERFNRVRISRFLERNPGGDERYKKHVPAHFDSRVFSIPSKTEVENYMIWRQQDATRNSISSVAQSLYKHTELNGKITNEMQEMIFQKGTNWNDFASKYKRGRMISKEISKKVLCDLTDENKIEQVKKSNPDWYVDHSKNEFGVNTLKWTVVDVPIFTQDKQFLFSRIPDNS